MADRLPQHLKSGIIGWNGTAWVNIAAVESTSNPGTYGLVALASTGSDIAGGGGGGGGGTEYTEDAAAAANPVGPMTMAVRQDTLASEVTTNGDNIALRATSKGELYVKHNDSLTVTAHDVTNAGTFAVQSASSGNVAHDAADSGNPVKIGGKATSSEPAAVATGDRANLITDLVGKLITLPYSNPENFVSGAITTAMTGTTSTSLVAAPGAGLRNYITTIIVSNAHASVGTDVVIQDGSGGTTLITIPAAFAYGGAIITLPTPLRQPTTNTALFCANVTTGASTKVSAVGYKGA